MILVSSSLPPSSKYNRLLSLEEGAAVPHFVKMQSGSAGEIQNITSFGKVTIYKVK